MTEREATLNAMMAVTWERTVAPPDEFQTVDHALSFIERDDSLALLAAALLESIAFDLSLYHREGWWKDDPAEMLAKVGSKLLPCGGITFLLPTPTDLLRELRSEYFDALCAVVKAFSRGSTMGGRGGIIRMAKRMSERNKVCRTKTKPKGRTCKTTTTTR